jgi:hypothetical protein
VTKIVFGSVGLVAFGVVLHTLMAKFSLMRSSSAVAEAAPLRTLVPFAAYGSEAAFFLTSCSQVRTFELIRNLKPPEDSRDAACRFLCLVLTLFHHLPYFTIASYCFNILLSVSLVSHQSLKVGVVGCSHVHLLWTQNVILLDCGEVWFQLLG